MGDGEWEDRATNGVYLFQEQDADSRGIWIYLRDDSRNINVRIPVGGGLSGFQWGSLQRESTWYDFYTVSLSDNYGIVGFSCKVVLDDRELGTNWNRWREHMSATVIGRVKSTQGKSYEVKWDLSSKDVYVSWGGWSHVGKASTATEAMAKAEAWLYGK